ncbi:hypothetical protein BKA70DRAFT_592192 [Coprinopsis sp. MPI-PUGE-AT-0042]|nr:hypothetical protein BKA70DRAFT_592192 [Coprinopsis sp. MPI-PUGE-AT-0042]
MRQPHHRDFAQGNLGLCWQGKSRPSWDVVLIKECLSLGGSLNNGGTSQPSLAILARFALLVIISALLGQLAVPIANDLQALCETLQLMGNSTVPSLQSRVSEVLKPSKQPYEYDDGSDPPSRQCTDVYVGIGQYGMHLLFCTIMLGHHAVKHELW